VPTPLTILLDTPQMRLSEDAVSLLCTGQDWDLSTADASVYVSPTTGMAMLRPGPKSPEWTTTQTGIFAKYSGLSDFGLTGIGSDGRGWALHQADSGGPFYKYVGANTGPDSGGVGGFGPVQPANQPMVLEFFVPNVTNAPFGVMECGWGASATVGVSLRFYQDGHVEVWKDGAYLFTGSISELRHRQSRLNSDGLGRPVGYVTVMLIPCCDRSLLVESSVGGGFLYDFLDLAEGLAGQTITPNDPFWFNVPAPCDAVVRVAPLQYAQTSGGIYGPVTGLRVAPESGASWTTSVFQASSQAVLSPLGSTGPGLVSIGVGVPTANPFAIANPVQLQATLSPATAGTSFTPFVYGVRASMAAQTRACATPSGSPVDVTAFCTQFALEASDHVGGLRASMTLRGPTALAVAGVSLPMAQCGRAVTVSDGSGVFLDGVCEPPETDVRWALTEAGAGADSVTEVRFGMSDVWKLATEYVFLDPLPLDGLNLLQAYNALVQVMGLTANVSESAAAISLPIAGVSARGGWNALVLPGDKGAEWLQRLHETYAATWRHGVNRSGQLCLFDPADTANAPTTSSLTLYPSLAAAAGIASPVLYRSLKVRVLEPEANDLALIGVDARSERPILVRARDAASADPTAAVGDRPSNWLGRIKRLAYGDRSLATPTSCALAAEQLFDRLSTARTIVEFESEFLDGLWLGDLVTLQGAPGFGNLTVRLKAISARFRQVGAGASTWRPTRYVGEVGPLVCPLGIPGADADTIAANWKLKSVSKRLARAEAVQASRRPPIDVQVIT